MFIINLCSKFTLIICLLFGVTISIIFSNSYIVKHFLFLIYKLWILKGKLKNFIKKGQQNLKRFEQKNAEIIRPLNLSEEANFTQLALLFQNAKVYTSQSTNLISQNGDLQFLHLLFSHIIENAPQDRDLTIREAKTIGRKFFIYFVILSNIYDLQSVTAPTTNSLANSLPPGPTTTLESLKLYFKRPIIFLITIISSVIYSSCAETIIDFQRLNCSKNKVHSEVIAILLRKRLGNKFNSGSQVIALSLFEDIKNIIENFKKIEPLIEVTSSQNKRAIKQGFQLELRRTGTMVIPLNERLNALRLRFHLALPVQNAILNTVNHYFLAPLVQNAILNIVNHYFLSPVAGSLRLILTNNADIHSIILNTIKFFSAKYMTLNRALATKLAPILDTMPILRPIRDSLIVSLFNIYLYSPGKIFHFFYFYILGMAIFIEKVKVTVAVPIFLLSMWITNYISDYISQYLDTFIPTTIILKTILWIINNGGLGLIIMFYRRVKTNFNLGELFESLKTLYETETEKRKWLNLFIPVQVEELFNNQIQKFFEEQIGKNHSWYILKGLELKSSFFMWSLIRGKCYKARISSFEEKISYHTILFCAKLWYGALHYYSVLILKMNNSYLTV